MVYALATQTCASENICGSTGYFRGEDECVKICLPGKENSGFDCLPNVTQIISDVVKCSAPLPRFFFRIKYVHPTISEHL